MSGGLKAILIIALAVVVLVAMNVAMWRRMRMPSAVEARRISDSDRELE